MCVFVCVYVAQSASAVQYTDYTFAEELGSPNKSSVYDTKQSDGETPVMLEFGGMQSTALLPSLPGQLWPEW